MAVHQRGEDASAPTAPVPPDELASLQLVLGHRAAKDAFPDAPMAADVAAAAIRSELLLDGNARLNLATFVTTWMEPEADALIADALAKNMIDKDEYPQTAELERRCVSMLADLWHAPHAGVGCSTTGSSEAGMLGGLALKRRWQHARQARSQSRDRPNLVLGINAQVCWEKFCNYFEVEPRFVPMQGDRLHLDAAEAVARCDENTIGVMAILGSTFDGSYEPVAEISSALDELAERTGIDVPIHVDGASGAMVAPFLDLDLRWDFRLPRVASINTSGHKYGKVYPGVGWIVWRDEAGLPDDLVFRVNYLGGELPTFALNFSRPGAQVIAQYFEFLRLGREGFRAVQQSCRDVATSLAGRIGDLAEFELVTDGSELPVFAFRVADQVSAFDVFDVSRRLRERGWLVPAYRFPADRQDLLALRVVIREGNVDLMDLFFDDLVRLVAELNAQSGPAATPNRTAFHH
ncbi:MAG: glutamate decarboxylase [Propionibacteriaceae bacterium]